MKRFGSILLAAGCLFGTLQSHARQLPAEPAQGSPKHPAQELPAGVAAERPAAPQQEFPADFAAKAHAAARELRMLPPEEFSLQWLREEVDPIQRARRKIREEMQHRAMAQESVIKAHRHTQKRDLNKEVGSWHEHRQHFGRQLEPFSGSCAGRPDDTLPRSARRPGGQTHRPDESPRQDAAARQISVK